MQVLRHIFAPRMLSVLVMGFSSGLPLLLIGGTLKVWMARSNIDLKVIGIFTLVQLPYSLKFLWSPLLDRFSLPFLGRRRGWMAVTQLLLAAALAALAVSLSAGNPVVIARLAFAIAFLSATQDILIDAYRREILEDSELGFGVSLAITGARLGILTASGFSLILADHVSWTGVYFVMAGLMGVGLLATLLSQEPKMEGAPPDNFKDAIVLPFIDYFKKPGALIILAFILFYKVGDSMASDMLSPFYVSLGFTNTEIGAVSKLFGFWAVVLGGLLGGAITLRLGIQKCLLGFGVLQAISTLGFCVLANQGNEIPWLAGVVAFENLTSGMGTAAYAGFMASLCNRRFSATQYALLSSLMGLPRTLFGGGSGYLAQYFGWENYFLFCATIALPGLLLYFMVPKGASGELKTSNAP